MAFATAGDVGANLGRPLSAAEDSQARLWIGWAEQAIFRRMGSLFELDADVVSMVVVEAVTARLRSPEPVTQVDVQVDDASVSKRYQKSSGLIEITDEWWSALGWSGTSGAFTVTPYGAPDVAASDAWA